MFTLLMVVPQLLLLLLLLLCELLCCLGVIRWCMCFLLHCSAIVRSLCESECGFMELLILHTGHQRIHLLYHSFSVQNFSSLSCVWCVRECMCVNACAGVGGCGCIGSKYIFFLYVCLYVSVCMLVCMYLWCVLIAHLCVLVRLWLCMCMLRTTSSSQIAQCVACIRQEESIVLTGKKGG